MVFLKCLKLLLVGVIVTMAIVVMRRLLTFQEILWAILECMILHILIAIRTMFLFEMKRFFLQGFFFRFFFSNRKNCYKMLTISLCLLFITLTFAQSNILCLLCFNILSFLPFFLLYLYQTNICIHPIQEQ